ncbi:hypothetical protein [Rhodopirellula baltica]|uniref:hypothetical protein n=1 Tax=Rhodopirellula baltica TaxID=265606 RepID=UPI0011818824|nr:hypothetical protein [Rhodopirellula baltica]
MRYRGLVQAYGVSLITQLAAWYFYDFRFTKEALAIPVSLLLVGLASIGMLWFLRLRYLRKLDVDERLHCFLHGLRDRVPQILAAPPKSVTRAERLASTMTWTSQQLASYYRDAKSNTTINCAIRLVDDKGDYHTRARSENMDPNRVQNTEPIPGQSGLAKALRSYESQGVFLIPTIKDAVDYSIWKPNATDNYPDVVSLMVAPINAIERGDRAMVGILYLTAKKKDFAPFDTLSCKAFADTIGLVVSAVAESEAKAFDKT